MDILHNYSDQNDHCIRSSHGQQNNNYSSESSPPRLLPTKSAAPKVDDTMLTALTVGEANRTLSKPIDPTHHVVPFNPTYDQLWAPLHGPAHPYAKDRIAQGMSNHKLGYVEDTSIEPFVFDEHYNTFYKFGYAVDPSASAGYSYVGDLDSLHKNDGVSVYNIPQHEHKRRKLGKKKESADNEDVDGDYVNMTEVDNPATDMWLLKNKKSPWAGKKEGLKIELTEEQKKYAEEYAKKKGDDKSEFGGKKGEVFKDKSTFHGKEERDYQGRCWITPPKDAKASNDHCYIPKKLVHTWSGHTKAVSAIRFFPKYGHLILSASMDTKVKIWDVCNSGGCMRTYMGHSKAVRDVCFSNDGTRFLSAGYDKNIKYWDTGIETKLKCFIQNSDDLQ